MKPLFRLTDPGIEHSSVSHPLSSAARPPSSRAPPASSSDPQTQTGMMAVGKSAPVWPAEVVERLLRMMVKWQHHFHQHHHHLHHRPKQHQTNDTHINHMMAIEILLKHKTEEKIS